MQCNEYEGAYAGECNAQKSAYAQLKSIYYKYK